MFFLIFTLFLLVLVACLSKWIIVFGIRGLRIIKAYQYDISKIGDSAAFKQCYCIYNHHLPIPTLSFSGSFPSVSQNITLIRHHHRVILHCVILFYKLELCEGDWWLRKYPRCIVSSNISMKELSKLTKLGFLNLSNRMWLRLYFWNQYFRNNH